MFLLCRLWIVLSFTGRKGLQAKTESEDTCDSEFIPDDTK